MKQKKISIYVLILFTLLLPWFNGNYLDSVKLNSVEQNTIESFFEINPCKISFFEYTFQSESLQDVTFNADDSSPMYCFGRISQYKNIDGNINVYVGTNFFIGTLMNIFFIVMLIKIISKDSDKFNKVGIKTLFKTSVLISLLIFSDYKFYEEILFLQDLRSFNTYLFIFCFVFLLLIVVNDNINIKNNNLINYLPFLFLLSKNISQSNLSIFVIYFALLGIQDNTLTKRFQKIRNLYIFGIILWSINARIVYEDYPINYLGFTSTSYDFYSIITYSIIFYFVLIGLSNFKNYGIKKISLDKLVKNFYLVFLMKIILYWFSIYSTITFVLSNYFTVSINPSDEVNVYNFLNNNIDFLVLMLFFSITKILSYKKLDKIHVLSGFYTALFFANSLNFYKIFYSKYIESNIKFFELYNPTYLEFLFGSGPLNFNQFNFEINSSYIFNSYTTFTSFLLFFGVTGTLIASFYLLYLIKRNLNFSTIFLIQFVFLVYLSFSGIINNVSSLANFYILFSILFNSELNSQLHRR